MELKDAILSTLAEMEDNETTKKVLNSTIKAKKVQTSGIKTELKAKPKLIKSSDDELEFLNSFKERLLVLFEGFKSPNNVDIDSKIDITLNFLEYALAKIDSRVEKLERGNK